MSTSTQNPIRLAIIGAGIFARDTHLPSLLRHPHLYQIVAIYSRTLATAQSLAEHIPYPVEIYTDLDAILARPDVEAVDIVLPIAALATAIRKALAAGKHILSEKPIAADVATGRELLAQYAHHSGINWMVGENWRYEAAFLKAAETLQSGLIGTALTCHWAVYTPITDKNKYYHTEWRRNSSVPGGWLTDGGVHHFAALRLVLGEITQVSATIRQNSPDLPPADTVAATLAFASGTIGTYVATYATGAPWLPQLYIGGSKGSIRVQRKEIEITIDGKTERIETDGFDGVEKEFIAFANSIRTGVPHRNTPEEALADLIAIEALLTSAETGQPVTLK